MPPAESSCRHAASVSRRPLPVVALALLGLFASLFTLSGPQAATAVDTTPPTSPGNLEALSATQTSVTLAWTASTDGVGVVGYRIDFASRPPARTKSLRYTQGGLACGTSYSVSVRAYDHVRNLSLPATAVVSTTPCLDLVPPSTPTGLTQVARGATNVTMAWSASTDNVAVAGYAVALGGLEFDMTDSTSYAFAGLRCGSTYVLSVQAYDVSGNRSPWASFYASTSSCGDVAPPTAPGALTQVGRTQTSVSLSWSASTDDVGVSKYSVYRDGSFVSSTTALSASVSGLACGTSYTIGVEAVDGAGNRSARTQATMATSACSGGTGDTQAPTSPTNLSVTQTTASSIAIAWSPATDNVGVAGYNVYRNGVQVHGTVVPAYTFTGLSCSTAYGIQVEAYDAAGNVSPKTSVTASTGACSDTSAPTAPQNLVLLTRTTTSLTVSWASSTDNVAVVGYGAYLDGAKVGTTGDTTYTFTGLACGTSRTVGVDAYDAAGNTSSRASTILQTAPCGDTQAPSAPGQLSVSGATSTSISLSWSASSDNVSVAGYDVYVNGAKSATVSSTSATVGALSCGTAYTLGVEAFDASGNRSSRSTVSGSTSACASPTPSPSPSPPASGGSTKYVSTSGSDGNPCTQTAPCASFSRAYLAASPGDVVEVTSGSYPAQTLPYDPSKTSTSDVVFEPPSGASVSLAGFVAGDDSTGAGAKHFELRGMRVAGELQLRTGTEDVVLRDIDGDSFNLNSARNVQILGGDWGPALDTVDQIKGGTQNVLIDGARFHDFTISYPGKHAECIHIWAASQVTIRDSTFERCTDFDIFAKREGGAVIDGLVFENNMLDIPMPGNLATDQCGAACPRGGNSIRFSASGGDITNSTARYNSLLGGIGTDGQAGVTLKENDMTASDFVDPVSTDGTMDLHLKAGASAIGAGDPKDYPSTDIDGQSRPQGGAPDAGADER